MWGSIGSLILAASLAAAPPAQAQCWSDQDVDTAKLSDMQALLGVMATRCEAAGHGTRADYQAFLAAGRTTIAMTNQRLKARFFTLFGPEEGARRLNAFALGLADTYMTVDTAPENCAQVADLAREAAAAGGSLAALIAVATRNGFTPALPEASCRMQVAAAQARTAAP